MKLNVYAKYVRKLQKTSFEKSGTIGKYKILNNIFYKVTSWATRLHAEQSLFHQQDAQFILQEKTKF